MKSKERSAALDGIIADIRKAAKGATSEREAERKIRAAVPLESVAVRENGPLHFKIFFTPKGGEPASTVCLRG